MLVQLIVVLAILALSAATLFPQDPSFQKAMWEQFKLEHNRKYETMEIETVRFGHFLKNLMIADLRNQEEKAAGGSATHGVTKFSDLSEAEFAARFLTSNPALRSMNRVYAEVSSPVNATAGLVDWTGIYTTPVKDQGYCGSCWAFSAMEQIESDSMRTLGTSYLLSAEQIVQCDTKSSGCNGGWTEYAWNYVQAAGGITTEANYPYSSYSGTTGTCNNALAATKYIKVGGYTALASESAMASYVQTTGPLSICIGATKWSSYTGGIMTNCPGQVDHCVQAVGVDASTGGYWKVRNQWGTNWGESGFIRLSYGSNTCKITTDPSFVTVSKA